MKLTTILLALVLAASVAHAGQKEIKCLAENIYYESSGESLAGKLAVAKVTLNRTEHPNYPNTICEVVYQKHQFSWTRDKALRAKPKDSAVWREAINIATDAYYSGLEELDHFKAISFHNLTVKPKWNLKRVAKIGKHIFYRDKDAKLQRNR